MLHKLSDDTLVILLRKCYFAPRCSSTRSHRPVKLHHQIRSLRTSTGLAQRFGAGSEPEGIETPNPSLSLGSHANHFLLTQSSPYSSTVPGSTTTVKDDSTNIAIIGGGITGLASAHYLLQYLPNANITLYEASDRMGGWLQSKHVNIGDGKIVFEQGPRNLRPKTTSGLATLEMIKAIGLEDEIITTPKDSIAAKSRFVYYPDHLVRMPGPGESILRSVWQLMTEPIYKGIFTGAIEDLKNPFRSSDLNDESVGAFFERRLGNTHVGDNLVSAILHGIYAGDIYQLSMKSVLPKIWYFEGKYGSLLSPLFKAQEWRRDDVALNTYMLKHALPNGDLAGGSEVIDASVYSFKQGIGALSDGLVTALKSNPRVKLRTGAKIEKIALDKKANTVKISCSRDLPPVDYDRVVCTIAGRTLSQLTSPGSEIPSLSKIHAVTVMIVNLYYANPTLLPVHGFGYLIPRSVPWNQNPERALGVVFDSDANVGQDTVPGTKVTVMLGGHWWDDWPSYPDEAEGAAMAQAILKRHLKIDEKPMVVNVGLQRECIPQYTVGHTARMKEAHTELMREFRGKLAVAGTSYTGVGLNDCVRAARDLAIQASHNQGEDEFTGLERFIKEAEWTREAIFA